MSRSRASRVPTLFSGAAFLLFLLPGVAGSFGPFIDELYYVSCAHRLDWGYVDHPPFSIFLLRLFQILLGGQNLLALRLPAALTGCAVVLGIGLLARRLGAGSCGQAVACGSALIAGVFQLLFGFYSMNAIEILIWLACSWTVVEAVQPGRERWWILFGLLAGIGLLNKHTFVLFGAALALGLFATPARRSLRRRWIWLGLAIASILIAPNLVWEARHGWPSLEFYRAADRLKNIPMPPPQALGLLVVIANPGTIPVWVAGLAWMLRPRAPADPAARARFDLRPLGVLCLALIALAVLGHRSRPDRIAGIFPLLFAAGGVALERARSRPRWRWLRWTVPAAMAAWGLFLLPLSEPVLPAPLLARYLGATRLVPQIEAGSGKEGALPQWFSDRLGWQTLVDVVARVRDRLPAGDQSEVMFFGVSYGQASALDWLGRSRGLRPVYCTHNNWFLWGPPREPLRVAIVVGESRERLAQLFNSVELAGVDDCDLCTPWRRHMPIWVVRGFKGSITEAWPSLKHFE